MSARFGKAGTGESGAAVRASEGETGEGAFDSDRLAEAVSEDPARDEKLITTPWPFDEGPEPVMKIILLNVANSS